MQHTDFITYRKQDIQLRSYPKPVPKTTTLQTPMEPIKKFWIDTFANGSLSGTSSYMMTDLCDAIGYAQELMSMHSKMETGGNEEVSKEAIKAVDKNNLVHDDTEE